MTAELIDVPHYETQGEGILSVMDGKLPFIPWRTFWITDIPQKAIRGQHAHKMLEQFIICISGHSVIEVVPPSGPNKIYSLDNPHRGLYVPAMHWLDIYFEKPSVLLVFASDIYRVEDYIHDFQEFKSLSNPIQ